MGRTSFARRRSIPAPPWRDGGPEKKSLPVLPGTSPAIVAAIGMQIRTLRHKLELTGPELAAQANISTGLLSKIENGKVETSLETLEALARALNVPITTLLANYDEKRDCAFVPSGGGELISGRGIGKGHRYQLLGNASAGKIAVEPYFITLSDEAKPYTRFRHAGVEFIHILAGRLVYRVADRTYALAPGNSLLFDAADFHGPDELTDPPISFLSIIIYLRG